MTLKQQLTFAVSCLVIESLFCMYWFGYFNYPASAESIFPSVPKATASTEKDSGYVVLKEGGGSLYAIAKKHYHKANETLFDLIVQANPHLVNVRKIGDDQKIILPPIIPESYIGKTNDGEYRVHIGTFETFESAVSYSQRVTETEKLLYIESKDFSPEDTWYRVTMGDFEDKTEALTTVNLLKEASLIYIPEPPMERGQ
jgi:hypothetical protein